MSSEFNDSGISIDSTDKNQPSSNETISEDEFDTLFEEYLKEKGNLSGISESKSSSEGNGQENGFKFNTEACRKLQDEKSELEAKVLEFQKLYEVERAHVTKLKDEKIKESLLRIETTGKLNTENDTLRGENDTLRGENDTLRGKWKNLDGNVISLFWRLKEFKKQLEQKDSEIQTAKATIEALEAKESGKESEKETAKEAELKKMKAEIASKDFELGKMAGNLESAQLQAASLSESLSTSKTECRDHLTKWAAASLIEIFKHELQRV